MRTAKLVIITAAVVLILIGLQPVNLRTAVSPATCPPPNAPPGAIYDCPDEPIGRYESTTPPEFTTYPWVVATFKLQSATIATGQHLDKETFWRNATALVLAGIVVDFWLIRKAGSKSATIPRKTGSRANRRL